MTQPLVNGDMRALNFTAMLSLSQTQRRLAHRAKSEALKWLSDGNTFNYNNLRQESDRLWRDAKYHLAWAKRLSSQTRGI